MAEGPYLTTTNKVATPIIIWNTNRLGVKTIDDFVAMFKEIGVDMIHFEDDLNSPKPKTVWLLDRKTPEPKPTLPAPGPQKQMDNLVKKESK